MSLAATVASTTAYTSIAVTEPTNPNRLIIPDQSGTFLTTGNYVTSASNGAVHSMKIENSFSVGGDVHLGTAGDGSATFLGGT